MRFKKENLNFENLFFYRIFSIILIIQLIFFSPGRSFLRIAGYNFTLCKGEGEAEDRILRMITLVYLLFTTSCSDDYILYRQISRWLE